MAFDDTPAQERTEQPTGKRREDARRRGRVAVSTDLTGAAVLLGALGVHVVAGGTFVTQAVEMFRERLAALAAADLTPDGALALGFHAVAVVVGLAWPFVALPALVAIAVQLLQTRFAISTEGLTPDWSRLNPLRGLARLLGGRGLVELLKATLKLALVGTVAFLTLRAAWPVLVALGAGGSQTLLVTLADVAGSVWLRIGLAYLALAGLDYGYRWWQHEKSLRMTKEEVRQESKDTDGNPLLRGRLRALHRQMATRRMMTEVRRADVVLRNPTHVAVALRYDATRMKAPRVVGKGERLLAERIIDVAARHGVPVIENPPLARAVFKAVAIGREIPQDLYRAVAEVLAYVYSLKGGAR